MAEVVLMDAFAKTGLEIEVESFGLSAQEVGCPIDSRAAKALAANGLSEKTNHRSRQISFNNLESADFVITMTKSHAEMLETLLQSYGLAREVQLWRWFDANQRGASNFPDVESLDIADPRFGNTDSDYELCLSELMVSASAIVDFMQRIKRERSKIDCGNFVFINGIYKD